MFKLHEKILIRYNIIILKKFTITRIVDENRVKTFLTYPLVVIIQYHCIFDVHCSIISLTKISP